MLAVLSSLLETHSEDFDRYRRRKVVIRSVLDISEQRLTPDALPSSPQEVTRENAEMAEDLEAVSSQRDAMRTMLGKLGTLLEHVVGLAFPKPSASEGAVRMPGAKLRDRLQEKLRGILFRYYCHIACMLSAVSLHGQCRNLLAPSTCRWPCLSSGSKEFHF